MQKINIRNCQIVQIQSKTHIILLSSKEDLPDAQKIIDNFFNKFEIIKISPLVQSGELIKPTTIEPKQTQNIADRRTSVLSQYLQIKDSLKDTFTASVYCDALKTIGIEIRVQSVYYSLNKLVKLGKLTVNKHTMPITYTKIHAEYQPMPSMVNERKNLIDSCKS